MTVRGWRYRATVLLVLLLTAAVYSPGLAGGYLFDDAPNIVDNQDLHVSSLDWNEWRIAALASPSAELRRPLAMLSFAANYYFTGLDPFPMKLANLLIHLLNGLLLWQVLLETLRFWQKRQFPAPPDSTVQWAALGIACAWMLAPINVSGVLYVVQRMESLAQVFVLGGLWLYLCGRRKMLGPEVGRGALLCACGLLAGSGIGALSKESAVLLPVYAALLELLILRFECGTPGGRRALWAIFGLLLIIPMLIGLAWLVPRSISTAAYSGRPFTLGERLLTECRVLVSYIGWTLFPEPARLSFYHDDLPLSRGWLQPPTTLISAGAIAGLIAAAVVLRRRLPLFSLGIGWYFAAHLLTSTIIPLELVFEHRNYFASAGLLLAAGALILAIPREFSLLRVALPVLALAAFSAVTWLRAMEWRHPLQLAYSEAGKHPQSARANYELGRTLIVASGYRQDSKLIDPAMTAFERAGQLADGGASPWSAMIVVAGHMHRSTSPEWWSNLTEKLAQQPPSAESISALESLSTCQHQGDCPEQTQALLSAFLAALGHPAPSGRLLAAYGTFAANQLGDYALAEQALSDALLQLPDVSSIRINLVKIMLLEGKADRAREVLATIDAKSLSSVDADHLIALRRAVDPTSKE